MRGNPPNAALGLPGTQGQQRGSGTKKAMVSPPRAQGLVGAATGGMNPRKGGRMAAGAPVGPRRSVAAEDGWLSRPAAYLAKQLHHSPEPFLKSVQVACMHVQLKGTTQASSPPR